MATKVNFKEELGKVSTEDKAEAEERTGIGVFGVVESKGSTRSWRESSDESIDISEVQCYLA